MRCCERGFGRLLVADRHVEQYVAGMFRPDLRRALLDRIHKPDHGRQRAPVDLNRLGRVARLIDGLRDHKGHGIADMAHHIPREDRIWRPRERILFQIEQARQIAEFPDILRGEDGGDPGQTARADNIDGELGMRMRRAQHQRMQRGLRRVVVGIAALAANQRVIFLAKHALTDAEFDGSHYVSISRRCVRFNRARTIEDARHIAADYKAVQTPLCPDTSSPGREPVNSE